jgi:hypothetical protein
VLSNGAPLRKVLRRMRPLWSDLRTKVGHLQRSELCRFCSLIPGFCVKLSAIPPHLERIVSLPETAMMRPACLSLSPAK